MKILKIEKPVEVKEQKTLNEQYDFKKIKLLSVEDDELTNEIIKEIRQNGYYSTPNFHYVNISHNKKYENSLFLTTVVNSNSFKIALREIKLKEIDE